MTLSADKTSAGTSWFQNLTFSWFDVAFVLIIAFGFWRGRKRGMSREALPTATWLVAVIAAGFASAPLGDLLNQTGHVGKFFGRNYNSRTMSMVICYLVIFAVVFFIYSLLKKFFKEKLSGSNTFGSNEYYLGMIAGVVRYACITVFFLALLNAPFYSSAEIVADKAFKNRWFGGGQSNFSGDFFPSIYDIQSDVFKKSLLGRGIKEGLTPLLIQSGAPVKAKGPGDQGETIIQLNRTP
jgi:uncharacterized membrane protein required for colicin V production